MIVLTLEFTVLIANDVLKGSLINTQDTSGCQFCQLFKKFHSTIAFNGENDR